MLAQDEREQRELERMRFALDQAEAIFADIGVLRSKGDEAFLGQPDGVPVIGWRIQLWVGYVGRPPFQAVLANHYGTPFTRLQIFGNQQNSISEDVRATRPASPRSRETSARRRSAVTRGFAGTLGAGRRPMTSFQMKSR